MEIMQSTGFTRNRVMRLTGTLTHRGLLDGGFRDRGLQHRPEDIRSRQSLRAQPRDSFPGQARFEGHRPENRRVRLALCPRRVTSGWSWRARKAPMPSAMPSPRVSAWTCMPGPPAKSFWPIHPQRLVETVLAKTGMPKRTAATITDKTRLLKELENVRGQGYARQHRGARGRCLRPGRARFGIWG